MRVLVVFTVVFLSALLNACTPNQQTVPPQVVYVEVTREVEITRASEGVNLGTNIANTVSIVAREASTVNVSQNFYIDIPLLNLPIEEGQNCARQGGMLRELEVHAENLFFDTTSLLRQETVLCIYEAPFYVTGCEGNGSFVFSPKGGFCIQNWENPHVMFFDAVANTIRGDIGYVHRVYDEAIKPCGILEEFFWGSADKYTFCVYGGIAVPEIARSICTTGFAHDGRLFCIVAKPKTT